VTHVLTHTALLAPKLSAAKRTDYLFIFLR